jgi:F-type H+-transporting ATPase subunit a
MQSTILAAANPIDHVTDKPIGGQWFISNVTIMLVASAVLTVLTLVPAARSIATGNRGSIDDFRAQGLWANLVESICLYLRNQVFRPILLGDTDRFTPLLWSFFWFILICNLLGLVPILDLTAPFMQLMNINHGHGIGGTATQSIWVTAALAGMAFLYWNVVAFSRNPVAFLKHMTGGAPVYMWPIMIPVEIIGMFVKPTALALRLFANMTGGHIIIAVMLSFVAALIDALGPMGYAVAIAPLVGATAIYFLEIGVAFLQAYIFTFLVCIFLGQLIAHHDDHSHDHEHGHGHEHGHDHDSHAHKGAGKEPAAAH